MSLSARCNRERATVLLGALLGVAKGFVPRSEHSVKPESTTCDPRLPRVFASLRQLSRPYWSKAPIYEVYRLAMLEIGTLVVGNFFGTEPLGRGLTSETLGSLGGGHRYCLIHTMLV